MRLSLTASFFPQVVEAAEKRLGSSSSGHSGVAQEVTEALRAFRSEPKQ